VNDRRIRARATGGRGGLLASRRGEPGARPSINVHASDAPALARERNQEVVPALPAARAGEAMGKVRDAGNAAAESTGWDVATAQPDGFQLPRFTQWDRTPGPFALRMICNMRNANSGRVGLHTR
jgi:hypothetical protein